MTDNALTIPLLCLQTRMDMFIVFRGFASMNICGYRCIELECYNSSSVKFDENMDYKNPWSLLKRYRVIDNQTHRQTEK